MSSTFIIRENKKNVLSLFEMPRHSHERFMNFVETKLRNSNAFSKIEIFSCVERGFSFSLDALIEATEIIIQTIEQYGAEWELSPDFKNVEYTVDELLGFYIKLKENCKKLIGQNRLEFYSRII